jgi:hypothetical protein
MKAEYRSAIGRKPMATTIRRTTADVSELIEHLAGRRFWGQLQLNFQDGNLVRCVLNQSTLSPRQLLIAQDTQAAERDAPRDPRT